MRSNKPPTICVSPATGKPGSYVATFTAEFLDATFSVLFPENITGAVALHGFAEMIRHHCGRAVKIEVADDVFPIRNPAVRDILASIGKLEPQAMSVDS